LVDRLVIGPHTARGGLGSAYDGAADGPVVSIGSLGGALTSSVAPGVVASVGSVVGVSVAGTLAFSVGSAVAAASVAVAAGRVGRLLGRLLASGPPHAASSSATERSASDVRNLTAFLLLVGGA
jgi:hypothetical protein